MLKQRGDLSPEQKALAANFNQALMEAGVTAKAVANACDITEQAVSNWKRTGKIAREHLPVIAGLTGWAVEELLSGKGQRPAATSTTIGTTILDLGAHIASLSPLARASIAPLIAKVVENPDLAAEAARTADAIARS